MMVASPIPVTIKLAPRAYQRLQSEARVRGYKAGDYAQMLFNAAYAARIGAERGDADLDEQVRLVFALAGQADTAAIARATGVPEPRVVKILEGFRTLRRGRPC